MLQNICGLFHGLLQTRKDKGRQGKTMRRNSEQFTGILSLVQKLWRQSNLIGLGDCLKAEKHLGIGFNNHVTTCVYDYRGFIYNNVEG